jgi:hypothetical protein
MVEILQHFGFYSMVRADYVAITGDACAAQILSSLEYWTRSKIVTIEEIERRNAESRSESTRFPVPDLWLYEKTQDFVDSLYGTFKRNKVLASLKLLKELGFVETKPSPHPWDQTLLWRLNIENIQEALDVAAQSFFKDRKLKKTKSPSIQIQTMESLGNSDPSISEQTLDHPNLNTAGLDLSPDLIYDSRSNIHDLNSNSPLTPQGEVVGKNFVDNGFEIQDASEEDAIANPLPTQKTQKQPLVQTEIPPQRINVPANENDSRFVASDPTAENMEARGAIAKTGAMQGSSCIDPGFLEFYRLFLNGCDAYKKRGRECTTHHAKSSLGKLWRDDPLRILGEIENWQKSKATTAQYPDTQNIDEIPEDELDAILKAIENKILLKEQQKNVNK